MICESCIDAALDEAGGDLEPEIAAFLAMEMGADLPDHFCERLEEPTMECPLRLRVRQTDPAGNSGLTLP